MIYSFSRSSEKACIATFSRRAEVEVVAPGNGLAHLLTWRDESQSRSRRVSPPAAANGGESGTPIPDAPNARKPPKNKDSRKARPDFVSTPCTT
jgi:hypothetical protein